MRRQLNENIRDFESFHKTLVAFVKAGKSCFSIRDKKEYQSWMTGNTIWMKGKDRQKNAEYAMSKLKVVFEIIQQTDKITTKMLNDAVGRDRSPIMALMVASGAVVESKD